MPPDTYIIRSKGSRDNPAGVEFEICSECRHVIGFTKKACACDGACHPVLQEWKEYSKKLKKVLARKPKQKEQPKPRRSYYNIN